MIVAGASAYPREIPHWRFAEVAAEVGAVLPFITRMVASGVYDIERVDFSWTSVMTNTMPVGAYELESSRCWRAGKKARLALPCNCTKGS